MGFNSDDMFSKEGEKMVEKHYLARGYEVENVREKPEYQSKDIDLLVTNGDYSFTVEVKRDSRIAGTSNFFIEIISNIEKSREGYFTKCKADYLYYIDSKSNVAYIFKPEELRKLIKKHKTRFITKRVKDYSKTILGLVVPIDTLRNLLLDEGYFWKEVQLEELTEEDEKFFIRREWK